MSVSSVLRHQAESSSGHFKGVPRTSIAVVLRNPSVLHALLGRGKETNVIPLGGCNRVKRTPKGWVIADGFQIVRVCMFSAPGVSPEYLWFVSPTEQSH